MTRIFLAVYLLLPFFISAQETSAKPKLVVGIVVDQMRYDYLNRFWNKYGNDGFKRLVTQGYNCRNIHFNYVPTYTGPGHASIYTGTTPSIHGIIANSWFERSSKRYMYCSQDHSVQTVGAPGNSGQMSPKNMLATSITDALKLSTNGKSKVIGIALKDRGAILPAGHSADAAFWYDGVSGNFVSSTYYMKSLPSWAIAYNKKERAKHFLSQPWNTLLPVEQYTESIADNNKFEGLFKGESAPVFPHDLPTLIHANGNLGLIRTTPFGNTMTREFAVEAIKNEGLGKGSVTDFVAISFSSTDYIGHHFGPSSVEVEDTYLRLDLEIAELLKFLDGHVGKGNYLLFLTADHAASEVPSYLMDMKQPAGYFEEHVFADSLNRFLLRNYGDTIFSSWSNQQVFLNHKKIAEKKLDAAEIRHKVAEYILTFKGVNTVLTSDALRAAEFTTGPRALLQAGFHQVRSGDVLVNLDPNWVEFEKRGTTHGSPFIYDTHVPLIWFGSSIHPGSTMEKLDITSIAPTLSFLLNIQLPSGSTGNVIPALVK